MTWGIKAIASAGGCGPEASAKATSTTPRASTPPRQLGWTNAAPAAPAAAATTRTSQCRRPVHADASALATRSAIATTSGGATVAAARPSSGPATTIQPAATAQVVATTATESRRASSAGAAAGTLAERPLSAVRATPMTSTVIGKYQARTSKTTRNAAAEIDGVKRDETTCKSANATVMAMTSPIQRSNWRWTMAIPTAAQAAGTSASLTGERDQPGRPSASTPNARAAASGNTRSGSPVAPATASIGTTTRNTRSQDARWRITRRNSGRDASLSRSRSRSGSGLSVL
ncbi:MAG: hypothetical protein AB7V58_10295 [Solirubrobacterales bacterium]